jgi:hypothetical protein
MTGEKEPLPVHESVNVKDYITIYKTPKWWKAVALVNMFGHDKILIYLWRWDDKKGGWKRKQKMGFNNEKDWEDTKSAIEGFMPKIAKVR